MLGSINKTNGFLAFTCAERREKKDILSCIAYSVSISLYENNYVHTHIGGIQLSVHFVTISIARLANHTYIQFIGSEVKKKQIA